MNHSENEDANVDRAFEEAVAHSGKEAVYNVLLRMGGYRNNPEDTLTIVANLGVHHLPEEYLRGEVFIASHGSLDFSSPESIHDEFARVLIHTAEKLKSKTWRTVYIVPFGPAPLSMQIKLLVYRVCGFESIEVMQVSGGKRVDVAIDIRELIVGSEYLSRVAKELSFSETMLVPGALTLDPSLQHK